MIHEHVKLLTEPIYEEIGHACRRVVAMLGDFAEVDSKPTAYVIEGRIFNVTTKLGRFTFWVGINGPRLFFIVNMKNISVEEAEKTFSFCFGGAEKVGWNTNYQPMYNGVSIWSTCTTDRDRALSILRDESADPIAVELTEEGLFWVTDIAMMVQSWIRTCERTKMVCHDIDPAPL